MSNVKPRALGQAACTSLLAVAAAFALAPAAGAATAVKLTVKSVTTDAISYRVSPVPQGEYLAIWAPSHDLVNAPVTKPPGKGPRAKLFRFSDHDAQGRLTWQGPFLRLGGFHPKTGIDYRLCIKQMVNGKPPASPAWTPVCSKPLYPERAKTSKPLADVVKVKVTRHGVALDFAKSVKGFYIRVNAVIDPAPGVERAPRKIGRGIKLTSPIKGGRGKVSFLPPMRSGESISKVSLKLEDYLHKYAQTVTR